MQSVTRPPGLMRQLGASCGARSGGLCALPRPTVRPQQSFGALPALPSSSVSNSRAAPQQALQRRPLGSTLQQQQRQQQRVAEPAPPAARARDPDALDGDEDEENEANKRPPTLLWRVLSAIFYLVPWIDSLSVCREIYRKFRNVVVLYLLPGPLSEIYFSSQFAPLIIFFVMFLSVVKNTKLHHFVRFNCMQAIMLDIAVMLFHILRAYLPSELKWSAVGPAFDIFAWTCCMGTVVYCVFWTLRGAYADIPSVSESVYIQVAQSEYA